MSGKGHLGVGLAAVFVGGGGMIAKTCAKTTARQVDNIAIGGAKHADNLVASGGRHLDDLGGMGARQLDEVGAGARFVVPSGEAADSVATSRLLKESDTWASFKEGVAEEVIARGMELGVEAALEDGEFDEEFDGEEFGGRAVVLLPRQNPSPQLDAMGQVVLYSPKDLGAVLERSPGRILFLGVEGEEGFQVVGVELPFQALRAVCNHFDSDCVFVAARSQAGFRRLLREALGGNEKDETGLVPHLRTVGAATDAPFRVFR